MPPRRTTLPLALLALVALAAVSVAAGWFLAASLAGSAPAEVAAVAEPPEPAYDASDPVGDGAPAPPPAPAVTPPASADPGPTGVPSPAPIAPAPSPSPRTAAPDTQPRQQRPQRMRSTSEAARAAPGPITSTGMPTTTGPAEPTPAPPPAAPVQPAPPAAPDPAPDPDPDEPEPKPVPKPESKPVPEPKPVPESKPVPKPRPPRTQVDPGPALQPYDPPPAIGIAPNALPPEGRSWAILSAARRKAPTGSQARADLDWLISFARLAATDRAPDGRQVTARRALRVNAWWYSRRPAPGERVIARDPDGIILTYKRGHGFMVNPVATIGRWRDLNDLWSPSQLAAAVLPMLTTRTSGGTRWAALEYFDVPGDQSAVLPGVSAMAQARASALFAKAWAATKNPEYLDAAERLLAAFAVPVDDGGVRAVVPDPAGGPPGIWYPERAYPGRPAWTGGALNGFMVALIELGRTASVLGSAPEAAPIAERADEMVERGRASLVRFLPIHDSGSWSYYGLLTPGKPWRSYLADLNYHCYHVALLRSLHASGPDDGLGAVAARWQGYVDDRGATCPAR